MNACRRPASMAADASTSAARTAAAVRVAHHLQLHGTGTTANRRRFARAKRTRTYAAGKSPVCPTTVPLLPPRARPGPRRPILATSRRVKRFRIASIHRRGAELAWGWALASGLASAIQAGQAPPVKFNPTSARPTRARTVHTAWIVSTTMSACVLLALLDLRARRTWTNAPQTRAAPGGRSLASMDTTATRASARMGSVVTTATPTLTNAHQIRVSTVVSATTVTPTILSLPAITMCAQ